MEELVKELAELQAEMQLIADKIAGDKLIQEHVTAITELQKQASEGRDALHDLISAYGQDEIHERIEDIKAQIIDAWDGEKKTVECDDGTLRFRTTSKLEIYHPEILLVDMFVRLQTGSEMLKYLSGFNKTAVKKYIGVHPQDIDVVELVSKTTVNLDQKSG